MVPAAVNALPPSAWFINLQAEHELRTGTYAPPSAQVLARLPELTQKLAPLFGPKDVVIDDATPRLAPGTFVGRAFCPTPYALARLEKVGAMPAFAPSL